MRLVLASNNAKKLAELQALFNALPLELVLQTTLGVTEAEEPHRSFVENAIAKARHASKFTGLAAIADDSGLCVDALGGLPGVDSAHIAPIERLAVDREQHRRQQDAANNAWLQHRLSNLPEQETAINARRAHYVCVLAALRRADDPEPLIATARWSGHVLSAARGEGGFGYDPWMRMDGCETSVAAMASDEKNRVSHRARAAAVMTTLMRERWAPWLTP